MAEPESLDEQALQADWHANCPRCPDCGQHRHGGTCLPEYQHPEDTMEVFAEYDRITDEQLGNE